MNELNIPLAICFLSVMGIALSTAANISPNTRGRVIGVLAVVLIIALACVR